MEHLIAVYEKFRGDLVILSISIDPDYDTVERLQEHRGATGMVWTIARDIDLKVKSDFNVVDGNTLFLIDWEGNIRQRYGGEVIDQSVLSEKFVEIPEFQLVVIPLIFMTLLVIAVASGKTVQSSRQT